MSSDKIIPTDRNTINEATPTEPTISLNDLTCTVITASPEQKYSKYTYVYDYPCNY